jgi:kynureninase
MAAIWASLKIFKEAGIHQLRAKSENLTSYLEFLVKELGEDVIRIITPSDIKQRGSQLSIQVINADKRIYDKIVERGVVADWREPDVIRIAPTAMYNSFEDVYNFVSILKEEL